MYASTKRHFGVVVALTGLTLLLTLPVVFRLTTHIAGSGGDPWQTLWRAQHTAEQLRTALTQGAVGSFILQELFGQGEARLVNLSAWPWLWLHFLVGQPLAYNLIWLATFILSGWGMYTLCRYLGLRLPHPPVGQMLEGAALFGGVVYMFLPFHFAHAFGHFGAMQMQWLPWMVLLLFRLKDSMRIRDGVLFAVLLIIQVWTEHHYALWLAIFTLILLAWHHREVRSRLLSHPRNTAVVGGIILLAVLVVLLSYWPTIQLAASRAEALSLGVEQTIRFSADPFAYVIPAVFHPLWGNLMALSFAKYFTGNAAEATQFLGIVPLLLLLFFHQHLPKREKYFWVSVASVFALISFGPRLHLMGFITPLPLPYALLDNLPIFSAIRTVARAGAMVGLALSVLVSLVVATQFRRVMMVVLVGIIILLEFLATPIPMQPVGMSLAYQEVAALPGEALIEIPAATNYVTASRALYASLTHGKTVIGNIALERGESAEVLDDARSLPALRQVLYLRTTHLDLGRTEFFNQDMVETAADVLREQKVAAFLVHTDSVTAHQATILQEFLEQELGLMGKTFDDVVFYPIDPNHLPPSDGVFVERLDGWEYAYDATRQSTFAEIAGAASVAVTNTTAAPRRLRLAFDFAQESHQGLQIEQRGSVVWEGAGAPPQGQVVVVTIPPGKSELVFRNTQERKLILQNPSLTTL